MSRRDQLQNFYRPSPDPENNRPGRGVKPQNPEEESERFYNLIHIKLSPRRLKQFCLINVVVIIGLLLSLFLCAMFLPKPKISTVEKRDLAAMPTFSLSALFSGQLTRDLEAFFSDTFPLREWFVTFSSVVDEGKGIRFEGMRVVAPSGGETQDIPPSVTSAIQDIANGNVPKLQAPESGASSKDETENTDGEWKETDEDVISGTVNNGTAIVNGRAMSLYGGSHESARKYAAALNKFHEELPDVQIYDMIIPTAAEFYLPKAFSSMSNSQKEVIDLIYDSLDDAIKTVDAYSAIKSHTKEYLYFRTDHHWTGLGAYYAYTAFCKEAGLTPLKISDFETRRLDNFIGTMYAQAQDSTMLKNPDYVDYYLFDQPYEAYRYDKGSPYTPIPHTLWGEYAVSPNSYSVFLQGDFPLIEVKTGIKNGRKIMIVKESFGNAFAPFLINHYEEVYIVDQRYFELAAVDFIKEKGINELIFANNSFSVCTPYHINCIDGLRHHTYYFYTPPAQPSIPQQADPEPPQESASSSEPEPASSSEPVKRKPPAEPSSSSRREGGLLKPRD